MLTAESRQLFAQQVCLLAGTDDTELHNALVNVAREQHSGPGPWHIEVGLAGAHLIDVTHTHQLLNDVAVTDAAGVTHDKPSMLVSLLAAARPRHGDQTVVIAKDDAADVAYLSALLNALTGTEPRILTTAERNVCEHATQCCRNADVLVVLPGLSRPPLPLMSVMSAGARVVLPLLGNEDTALYLCLTGNAAPPMTWSATPLLLHNTTPWPRYWHTDEAALVDAMSLYLPMINQLHCYAAYGTHVALSGDGWCLTMQESPTGPQPAAEVRPAPHQHSTLLKERATQLGLSAEHTAVLAQLTTPMAIQDFVNAIPMNFEDHTCWSVSQVLTRNTAMCIEGAFVAAAALYLQGYCPLIARQIDRHGEDHALALFIHQGHWGAISKTNHVWLRWRDPVYRTVRELMMSYVHEFTTNQQKGMIGYSAPLDLRQIEPTQWVTQTGSCRSVDDLMLSRIVHSIYPAEFQPLIRPRDAMEVRAHQLVEHALTD